MKVYCVGGKYAEPIEHEVCLECAYKDNGYAPCGFTYPFLKAVFANATSEDRTKEIHVTDLNTCLRKAYWSKVGSSEIPHVHDLFYIFYGQAIHKAIEDALKDDPYYRTELTVGDNGIIGRVDALDEKTDTMIDFKTTRGINLKKLPYGSHEEQMLSYYALASKKFKHMLLQYLDFRGATKCRGKNCPSHPNLVMMNGVPTCPVCGHYNSNGHMGGYVYEVIPANNDNFRKELINRANILKNAIKKKVEPSPEPDYICQFCNVSTCEFNPKYENESIPIVEL
jgi:CRISPR/Cas system-associated exonuclease Cas4 (RecB family)